MRDAPRRAWELVVITGYRLNLAVIMQAQAEPDTQVLPETFSELHGQEELRCTMSPSSAVQERVRSSRAAISPRLLLQCRVCDFEVEVPAELFRIRTEPRRFSSHLCFHRSCVCVLSSGTSGEIASRELSLRGSEALWLLPE